MFEINNRIISSNEPPYLIAELSANHCGSLENALNTIIAAKEYGADAIKLQTYKATSMTLNCERKDFLIKDGLWKGYKLFDLYSKACTPYEWHSKLFELARKIGITIFSSPFDKDSVELLEELNTPAYKIASFEITDLQLIKYVASRGKPILISTGMASEEEIDDAVKIIKDAGNEQILLFHCISSYPAPTKGANIKLIKRLRKKYGFEVGLSDHTLTNTSAIAAISLGATAIEKHFILDKDFNSFDSDFSINPKELRDLKNATQECWEALGKGDFRRPKHEQKNKVFRRSLYFIKDMERGELITENHIKVIRPGFGLSPKYIDKIINKKRVTKDIRIGDRVEWDLLN